MNRFTRWLPSRRWLFIPPVLVGMAVFATFALSRKELTTQDPPESIVLVNVLNIEGQFLHPKAKGYGTVRPSRTWTAIAEVSGSIVETHPALDSGKRVAAGDLLVRIDESDYELRVSQRQADLDSANARLKELEASRQADEASLVIETDLLVVNQEEFRRQQELKNQRATSTSEVDQARGVLLRQTQSVQKLKNAISLYPSRIAAATATLDMAKSRMEEARRDLDRTKIYSPFDGVLAGVNLEPNQVVAKNEELFQVQDARLMDIDAQFSLAQLDNLAPNIGPQLFDPQAPVDADLLAGLTAELLVRSGNFTMRWTGKPIRISDSVNQQTRTLGIVIQVDNQTGQLKDEAFGDSTNVIDDDANTLTSEESSNEFAANHSISTLLRAGTFCEVTLLGPPISNAIAVPRTAVDEQAVYVIEQDELGKSRLRKQIVKFGCAIDNLIIVEDGLVLGDQVAVKPPLPAIDGQLVSPVIVNATPQDARVSEAAWKDR